jgi:hypothetical protein
LGASRSMRSRYRMPKRCQPRELWDATRARDGGLCQHCAEAVALAICHIDHILSGKRAMQTAISESCVGAAMCYRPITGIGA